MTQRPLSFALTFVALFALTFAFLGAVDMLPNSVRNNVSNGTGSVIPAQSTVEVSAPEAPVRVVADKISLDSSVSNPDSSDVEVLDAALLKGAVRYPDSAMLGQEGTVLIFGHSSYLPIVHNQNYKAFDGIQNLKPGNTIIVYSDAHEYRYTVSGVRLANAEEDVVELPATGQHLVLVTCNSFATKSDRFIVSADLEGTYAL